MCFRPTLRLDGETDTELRAAVMWDKRHARHRRPPPRRPRSRGIAADKAMTRRTEGRAERITWSEPLPCPWQLAACECGAVLCSALLCLAGSERRGGGERPARHKAGCACGRGLRRQRRGASAQGRQAVVEAEERDQKKEEAEAEAEAGDGGGNASDGRTDGRLELEFWITVVVVVDSGVVLGVKSRALFCSCRVTATATWAPTPRRTPPLPLTPLPCCSCCCCCWWCWACGGGGGASAAAAGAAAAALGCSLHPARALGVRVGVGWSTSTLKRAKRALDPPGSASEVRWMGGCLVPSCLCPRAAAFNARVRALWLGARRR